MENKIYIFISYSHDDEAFKDDLIKYLKPVLKSFQNVIIWHDREMLTGSRLNEEIRDKLNENTLMLCLISPDYLSSDYCMDTELKSALDNKTIAKNNIFPIILRKCAWKHTVFRDLLAQPKDGKPIVEWSDKDDVYTEIADELARVLKDLSASIDNSKKKI
jgi:hypothetical protein